MQVALERVVDAKNAGIMSSGVSKLCEERRKLNINIAGNNTINANRRQAQSLEKERKRVKVAW